MELSYEKALKEHNLSVSDLPEDAQVGIDGIRDVIKGIEMLSKKGKEPTAKTMRKLKAMDKWVYYEILDFLHDTDKNEDEMPEDPEEVVAEIKQEAESVKLDPAGLSIESELARLSQSEKKNWSLDELKNYARATYNVIWNGYSENEENGVRTSNYELIETDEQVFTLKKR